jgi:hypothetical protein
MRLIENNYNFNLFDSTLISHFITILLTKEDKTIIEIDHKLCQLIILLYYSLMLINWCLALFILHGFIFSIEFLLQKQFNTKKIDRPLIALRYWLYVDWRLLVNPFNRDVWWGGHIGSFKPLYYFSVFECIRWCERFNSGKGFFLIHSYYVGLCYEIVVGLSSFGGY